MKDVKLAEDERPNEERSDARALILRSEVTRATISSSLELLERASKTVS